MRIKTKLLIVMLFLTVFYVVGGVVLYVRSKKILQTFNKIPVTVDNLTKSSELNSISQFIRYYDESLTQSARNYAFTGNAIWKDRYNETVPKLDEKIKNAISQGTAEDKKLFESIDVSNQVLIAMEEESMKLVDNGDKSKAIEILESDKYWQEKKIYQAGLEQYILNQGKGYDDTLTISTKTLDSSILEIKSTSKTNRIITALISSFSIFPGLIIYFLITFLIFKPLNKITKATNEIAKGNLTYQINTKSKDEIGQLADSFDKMSKNLNESHLDIEKKISDRTADLTKLNRFMTGREIKMIELKKEIEKLNENTH